MAKKQKTDKTDIKVNDALEVTNKFIENSRKDSLICRWEKTQYFLSGEMLLYQGRDGHWRPIPGGQDIGNGVVVSEESLINYPKDPHIVTLDNGITAKALGNPLSPQAIPYSSDDEDVEAAKKVSNFLLSHRAEANEDRQTEGVSMREEVIDWLKVTGNCFVKDWFDPSRGQPIPGLPDDEQLNQGGIVSEVVDPKMMLIPGGVKKFKEVSWIGQEMALDINYISETYGVKVEADEDLEDTRSQFGMRDSKQLENHAKVYEFYVRPSGQHPQGRKIVRTKDVVLYDGIYDAKLAASEYAESDWHPYSFAGWRRTAGQFWAKTMFEDLIPLQIKLNAQWKKLLDSDEHWKGWWISQKGTVDWGMVRTSGDDDGIPNIQYEQSAKERPFYQPPPVQNTSAIGQIQLIVARMNDILAQYETTRGNSDSNVTSGKQADVMNQSSNTQSTPILTAIVSLFMSHWRKVIHLAAVHFEESGREIRFQDPDSDDWNTDTFKPSDIRSDDVVLLGGNAFYQTPEARKQELREMAAAGFFGDILRNPEDRKAFLKIYDAPTADSLYSTKLADVDAAKRENNRFKRLQFKEDRPVVIQVVQKEYQAKFLAWIAAKTKFEQESPVWQQKMGEFKQMFPLWQRADAERQALLNKGQMSPAVPDPGPPPEMPGQPPQDPGPMPEQPHPHWRARPIEDHLVHIKQHREWRKSVAYEKLCRQYPELDAAMEAHEESHIEEMIKEKQKQMTIAKLVSPPQPPGDAETKNTSGTKNSGSKNQKTA